MTGVAGVGFIRLGFGIYFFFEVETRVMSRAVAMFGCTVRMVSRKLIGIAWSVPDDWGFGMA